MSHISASQINSYLLCPRQHRYRYVDRVPEPKRAAALAFGSAIHAALAEWYRGVAEGREHNDLMDPALRAFHDSWADALCAGVDFRDKDDPDALATKGVDMLHAFEAKAPRPDYVLAVEERFEVPLYDPQTGETVGPSLIGYIDAIVRYGDRTCILEHKTGARRWSADQVEQNLQCTLYHLAALSMGHHDPEVHVQLLTKTKAPALEVYRAERGPRHHRDALDTVSGVLRAVEAGADYPCRGWQCAGCAYREMCEEG